MIALDRFGFKAKTIDGNKQWGYGYFVPSKDNKRCLWYYDGGLRTLEIDTETISQCTGLEDSEGNLIYENDIIRSFDGDKTADFIVRFNENDLAYEVVGKTGGCCCLAFVKYWIEHGDKCVVVGNIFDNR